MRKTKFIDILLLTAFITLSLLIKIILIYEYKNVLNLSSDDLNYLKSAVVLIKKGIFVFHNYNEPTVFITPLYPLFLATIFKIFGYGEVGIQAARVVQALISCATIVLIFLIARYLINTIVGLIASFLVAFYIPNISTVGYLLTETLFTFLLCLLIYLSLIFSDKPCYKNFIVLGVVWAATVLCRPTIALYPVLYFIYLRLSKKIRFFKAAKLGVVMALSFVVFMSPWWIRNYMEYARFIPLAASSGNPMLQGTYVNYKQTPQDTVYYKLGGNALETNKIEVDVAKGRIRSEFKKDFWGYLRWYTIGKTVLFWVAPFYWKEYLGVSYHMAMGYHYIIIVFGFIGMGVLTAKDFKKYLLPILVVLYFNAIHCVYMAFDRYAFPLLPLMAIYSAFFLNSIFKYVCKGVKPAA
ncbi:MAG: glycosyltransferase family 39 protein [Clostridia bacterium]|nr:glycosyltransferase family 39 protein [Clostridia bacterium]